jgi:hypothetical protein
MEIVLTALTLGAPGGMQSYLLTVAPQLERLGHDVTLYATELGTMADVARSRGLRVTATADELPDRCDAVIAQDAITLLAMTERYPGAVRTLVVHSAEYDIHLPPQPDGVVAFVVVLNSAVERRVRGMARPPRIERLRQPVDTDRHRDVGTRPERPRRVLMLGNYLTPHDREPLVRICADAGLEWRQVGVHGELLSDPIAAITDADIVIGQGRSVLDAMACGRAAWVYGPVAGDGWVSPSSYPALEADGFRGRATDQILGAERFRRALDDFHPQMGSENRRLITLHHSAYEHAAELSRLLGESAPGREVDFPLRELARAVRTQYDAQSTLEAMTHQARSTRQEGEAAVEENRALRLEVAELEQRLRSVEDNRRWVTVSAALSPLDAARRRRRRRRQ